MATNPFLQALMQRVGPQLAQMPQMNSQWSQFTQNRPLFAGGGTLGMAPRMPARMPTMPNIPMQARRRLAGPMQMPRMDLTQFQQAARGNPLFAPPPSPAYTPPPPVAAPAAPAYTPPPIPTGYSPQHMEIWGQRGFHPDFANLGSQATGLGAA